MRRIGSILRRSIRRPSFRRNRERRNAENERPNVQDQPDTMSGTEPDSEYQNPEAENIVSSEMSQQASAQDQDGSSDEANVIPHTENIPHEQNADAVSRSNENIESSETSHREIVEDQPGSSSGVNVHPVGNNSQESNVQDASMADEDQRSRPKTSNLLRMEEVRYITKTMRGNPIRQDSISDRPETIVSSETSQVENVQDRPGPSSNANVPTAENNRQGRNTYNANIPDAVRRPSPPSANLLLMPEVRYLRETMMGRPVRQDSMGRAEDIIEGQNREDDGYSTD